jgi:hypothetical protein
VLLRLLAGCVGWRAEAPTDVVNFRSINTNNIANYRHKRWSVEYILPRRTRLDPLEYAFYRRGHATPGQG